MLRRVLREWRGEGVGEGVGGDEEVWVCKCVLASAQPGSEITNV